MNYFTDIKNDIEGYQEHLLMLKNRLNDNIYEMARNNHFHDAEIEFFKIKNEVGGENEEEKLPISIECILMDSKGEHYMLVWEEVKKFLFDYDLMRHTYWDTGELVADGLRGLDDWMCDEITRSNDEFISHEIVLASETNIIIHCKNIKLRRIRHEGI